MLGEIDPAAVYEPLSISGACFRPRAAPPCAALSVLTMAQPMSGRELVRARGDGSVPPRTPSPNASAAADTCAFCTMQTLAHDSWADLR